MPLPSLTHLQYVTLTIILDNGLQVSGETVRSNLAGQDISQSGPAFYMMMARLENQRLIKGSYKTTVNDGQVIKERHYSITSHGKSELKKSLEFYIA